jgi:hypothetical protein
LGKENTVETLLHKKYNYCKIKREWFIDNGTLVNDIQNDLMEIKDIIINKINPNTTIKFNNKTTNFNVAA